MSTHFPHLPRRQYAMLAVGIVLALLGAILAVFVLPDRADGATPAAGDTIGGPLHTELYPSGKYGYQVTAVDPAGNVSAKTAWRTVTMQKPPGRDHGEQPVPVVERARIRTGACRHLPHMRHAVTAPVP